MTERNWRTDPAFAHDGRDYYVIDDGPSGPFPDDYDWRVDGYPHLVCESVPTLADARLLAAAGRLLAACESLIGVFGYLESITRNGGFIPVMLGIDWRQRLADARAAVAKATGTAPGESSVGLYSIVTDTNDPFPAMPLDIYEGEPE